MIHAEVYQDPRLSVADRDALEDFYLRLHGQGGDPQKVAEVKIAKGLGAQATKVLSSPAVREALQALGKGALTGAGLFGVAASVEGGAKGLKAIQEKATFKRDLNRILEVYPHLREYPEDQIHLAYRSMRHLNPHFAKDPLVGGTLLGQILRSRDPSDPKSLRMEAGLAADLVRFRPREGETLKDRAQQAFQTGMTEALKSEGQRKMKEQEHAFRREMAGGLTDVEMEQLKSRMQRGRMAFQEQLKRTSPEDWKSPDELIEDPITGEKFVVPGHFTGPTLTEFLAQKGML